MPAPPPNGVSSTVRCRSVVQSRRSCTRRSSSPLVAGLADEREVERRQVLGEDRDDVDAHVSRRLAADGLLGDHEVRRVGGQQAAGRVEHDATAGDVDHRARSRATNGTRVRAPSGSRSTSMSCAGRCSRPTISPSTATVDVLRAQPGELVRVPGVVLVGRVLVDDQLGPAHRLGRRAVGDLRERHVPAALLDARAHDGQRTARGGLGRAARHRRRTGPRGCRSAGRARPLRAGRGHGRSARRSAAWESSRSRWAGIERRPGPQARGPGLARSCWRLSAGRRPRRRPGPRRPSRARRRRCAARGRCDRRGR